MLCPKGLKQTTTLMHSVITGVGLGTGRTPATGPASGLQQVVKLPFANQGHFILS